MNFKEQAEQLLAVMIDKALAAGEFIGEQIPLVIQELLVFNLTKSVLLSLFYLTLIIVNVVVFKKYIDWYFTIEDGRSQHNGYYRDHEPVIAFLAGGSAINLIFSTAALVACLITALKIWLAPRIYLLEYAANLIK